MEEGEKGRLSPHTAPPNTERLRLKDEFTVRLDNPAPVFSTAAMGWREEVKVGEVRKRREGRKVRGGMHVYEQGYSSIYVLKYSHSSLSLQDLIRIYILIFFLVIAERKKI
ncbi:hypothetical protein E2C01_069967 [Portunus trituberculatus]|uniref:Uncharacterized protein n=1 Tax=Portunus trituberculatus TaxID=210409 RepID=A0A5B7I2A9_PORTR|nr:hypothetical protein [Portunus trituberculatus]